VVFALLVALAMFSALLVVQNASAQGTYASCAGCHNSAKHSSNSTHAGLYSSSACATCHVGGFAAVNKGVTPAACGACHGGVAVILTTGSHAAQACGTTPGCHGVPSPTPTPTATAVSTVMTAKVAPTTVKLGKSVTISGSVTPAAQLAGAKVSILVNRKVGTKWTKAKAATVTAKATGAYSWKYKVTKKGSYQVKVSVKATTTFSAKSVTKTFKAK
jgi:hypothetical protein